MKKLITTALAASVTLLCFAQNPWQDKSEKDFAGKQLERRIIPQKYRTLSLDLDLMKNLLSEVPMRFSQAAEGPKPSLAMPMPNGGFHHFELVEAPIMHPDLAARYPYIRSYAGRSADDPTAYLRCGVTQKGFHAVIFSARHSTVYIDAYAVGDSKHYINYFKKDFQKSEDFQCAVESSKELNGKAAESPGDLPEMSGDCNFRTYMLALACTGEYAQFHGGTVPSVMAEYNVAMTRINGIFEKDLMVTMQLVANTDDLIFLNASTDPYSNGSGGAMLGQNQSTCDNIIGSPNYDIGHVFSTGGGGIASLFAVCSSGSKARGVTGQNSPVGDPFYVDYVAHEMGHQFGANHTQNNNCNRNNPTAVEPGSASTIMGYAGICDPDVQNNSDDYFHAISIAEMNGHITGSGNSCASVTAGGNSAPFVSLPASSYSVPISTPFVLRATGSDPDGDILTYCWEQMDNQVANMPPQANNIGGPAFRSLKPVEESHRYFPNLLSVLNNANEIWEVLPTVSRNMTFRCTARDNHIGGGCTDEANLTLNFTANAGPFLVTEPNLPSAVWTAFGNGMVTWSVANTDLSPVNVSQVEILLSVDGGLTYPHTLVASTPNDGSQLVSVPNLPTTHARVMVKALNNVFFDVSNKDFTIQLPLNPTFALNPNPPTQTVCLGTDAAFYSIDVQPVMGFNQTVVFSASGIPPGAGVIFNPPGLVPPGTTSMVVTNLGAAPPGVYNMTVTGTSPSAFESVQVELILLDTISAAPLLLGPGNGVTGVPAAPTTLTWQPIASADSYLVQVATDPAFDNIIHTATTGANTYQVPNTMGSTVYYWRVRASNLCNNGPFSGTFAFQTQGLACESYEMNTPIIIPAGAPPNTITDNINIPDDYPLASLQVSLDISHTWVSDLIADVITPSGTTLHLFDQPGLPGPDCEGDDIQAKFSDSAPSTAADFENSCNPTPPAINGFFQPITPFFNSTGEPTQGDWTLVIQDMFDGDGGSINSWSIDFCGSVLLPPAMLLINQPLVVFGGQTGTISSGHLQAQGAPGNIVFTLLSLPENGTLFLQGVALNVGDTFTQLDINNGFLTYTHDGSVTTADDFLFDVLDDNNGWLHNQLFQIEILANTIAATAVLTQSIDCHNANNAIITVMATGGNQPLQYSLNGGPYQSSNVFSNLGPGTYTATVRDALNFTFTTNTIIISNPPALIASATVIDDDITVIASGGTGSLEYSLDGVIFQSNNVFLDLPNGTYTIIVRDVNGCTVTTTAIVAVNDIVVIAVETPISCFGANDGQVTVVVTSGGNPPFQYSLNGGLFQSNPVFSNLSPGIYTATVMDADGFTQTTNPVSLTNPPLLTASANVVGDDITVNASGGTGSLEYSLDGVNFQSSNVFMDLPNGAYTITVRDENGCIATTTATVNVNNLNILATITQGIDCFGDMTGQITATASGGNTPYTFSLNGGPFQSSPVFSNLGIGTYTVTVMDDDGLTQTSNSVTLTQPAQLTASATVVGDDITVNASGGTGSLEYSLDGINFQSSNVFMNLPNGTYTITVLDENGCITTTTAIVAVNNLIIQVAITQDISCFGENDGTITATVSGGNPPYQYSLNGGSFQSSPIFNNLGPGTYSVTVSDDDGFTQTSNSVTLDEPLPLTAAATVSGNDITVNAGGGTGSLEYSLDGINFQASNEFLDLSPGNYTITVMDENGCTITVAATIPAAPLIISATVTMGIECFGDLTGEISATVNGGNPPYQFSLNGGPFQPSSTFDNLPAGIYTVTVMDDDGNTQTSNSVTIVTPSQLTATATVNNDDVTVNASGGTAGYLYSLGGGPFQASNQFFDVPNGTYTVVVSDANGCTATTTVTVLVNNLNVAIAITHGISCFGANDGEITVTAFGGSSPYEYSLNGGPNQSSPIFGNLSPGTYEVTVTDADGFTQTSNSVTLAQPTLLSASASVVDDDITVNVLGGTGPFQYSLDGVIYQANNQFFNLPNGSYNIIVLDANGCTATATATVFTNTLNLLASITNTISCFGGSDGEITVTASGGNPPYQFNLNGGPFQSSPVFQNIPAGSYTIMVMDSDGFTQTTNVTLSDPPQINISTLTNDYTVTVMATGGTGALQYNLDGGPFQSNPVFYPVASGAHTIAVMDVNGCLEAVAVTVTVPALTLSLSITQNLPCWNSQNGQLTATGGGGIPPYEYSLNGGPFQAGNVFSNLPGGNYTVQIRDSGGFVVSQNTTLVTPPVISASANVVGSNVAIVASGGTGTLQYSLDGGPFQMSNTFMNVSNGIHTVTIIDANGCEAILSVTVNASNILVTATLLQGVSCHNGMNAVISVTADGGTPPYEYSLDGINYQPGSFFAGLAPGIYNIIVKDATGATSTTPTITVVNPPALSLTASAFGPDITVVANGGTGSPQYSLEGGPFQSSNVFNNTPNGIYTVTVMDANGCSVSVDVVVNAPVELLYTVEPVSCVDVNDGVIFIGGVEGGVPPYLYSIDGGPFSSDFILVDLSAGPHIIVVQDASGYQFEAPVIVIGSPDAILLDVESVDNTLIVHASGGTGTLQYSIDGGQNFQADSVFINLSNGDYNVVVMDENGCIISTTANVNGNAVEETAGGLYFEVLPNPSDGLFTVKMGQPLVGTLDMQVFDVAGRMVLRSATNASGLATAPLDLRHLANGVYILHINLDERWGTRRLVVMK